MISRAAWPATGRPTRGLWQPTRVKWPAACGWFAREPADLEELVQDVFVEAYYSLPSFRGDGPFAAWLARIATRVGYRHWKQLRRIKEQPRDNTWWNDLQQRATQSSDPAAAAQLVHRLLDGLRPRDRLVLLLLYVEGYSLDEAARLSGWSKTMVKVQAYRARRRLRDVLAKLDVHSLQQVLDVGPAALETAEENLSAKGTT